MRSNDICEVEQIARAIAKDEIAKVLKELEDKMRLPGKVSKVEIANVPDSFGKSKK